MIQKIKIALLAALVALPAMLRAQDDTYCSPIGIPIVLSSNFAEMRTNHFHSGIDIKTGGHEGEPIYAIADGYISRINISPYGYGRALYITHPNGTMSVYAHLKSFAPEVEDMVRSYRYRNRKHSVNIYPEANHLPVRKGEKIGLSGNSGNSYGPHLHFEIRRSSNSATLNVVTRGHIKVKDTTSPTIVAVHHIEIDTLDGVPVRSKPTKLNLKSTEPIAIGERGYFIVETTDRMNGTTNRYGPYRVSLAVDGEEYVTFRKDEYLFGDTRCCNITAHYELQRSSKNELLVMARHMGNRVDMYRKCKDNGIVEIAPGEQRTIRVEVEDDSGNLASVEFAVKGREATPLTRPQGRAINHLEEFSYEFEGARVVIPAGALYEPTFYTQRVINPTIKVRTDSIRPLSKIHSIGDRDLPLDKAFNVSITLPEGVGTGGMCLATVSDNGTLGYAGGRYRAGRISGDFRSFGHYCVVRDTIPPTIKPSFRSGEDLTSVDRISFRLGDNFSGVNDYHATIDGAWAILEYHPVARTATIIFDTERMTTDATHTLRFTATDGAGNTTTEEYTFVK